MDFVLALVVCALLYHHKHSLTSETYIMYTSSSYVVQKDPAAAAGSLLILLGNAAAFAPVAAAGPLHARVAPCCVMGISNSSCLRLCPAKYPPGTV